MNAPAHNDSAKLRLIHDVGFDRHFKGSSWAEYNRQFFDSLAEKYDATNVMHSLGTKSAIDREAVRRLPVPPRATVLDVCTGSGDIAIEIARQHADARVVGIDAAPAMLRIATRKIGPLADRITVMEGDALALPFPDGTFNGAIISFGLRNLADLRAGLIEMVRVVRPGGFVCNIDQGQPRGRLFRLAYELHFRRLAPILGKLFFHIGEFNSFRYLPESNRYFPDQDSLCGILTDLGLRDVRRFEYWRGAVAQQVACVPGEVGVHP